VKTVQDQIRDLRNTRAAKAARMSELTQKSIDDGRSMDSAEAEEFDNSDAEIKTIDADLVRLERLEALNVQRGSEVRAQVHQEAARAGTELRGAPAIIVSREAEEKFKGQMFTRMVIAKALARLFDVSPAAIAEKRWGKTNPLLVEVIRTAVAGGGSGSGEWGAELVQADARFTGDFIEYLHEKTVFDKLPFREVPANVTIKGQDGTATGYWTGESKGIKVSKADFSSVSLTPLKVAALAVVSNELLRDSSPAAESLVRDSLAMASAQRVDATLFSDDAASSGVSPAGLLAGVSQGASGGTDAAGLREDVLELYQHFISAKNATGLYFVMNPALAKGVQLMVNALGQAEFPMINAQGGSLLGDPVVTGDNIDASHLILLKPSDIYKIGDGGLEVSISREATIEQDDAPQGASDTPVAASATLVNMFQTESTAIKVVRSINFAKRRSSAVQYIDDAAYGSSST
jgi:HK97 family phage major capsid protein